VPLYARWVEAGSGGEDSQDWLSRFGNTPRTGYASRVATGSGWKQIRALQMVAFQSERGLLGERASGGK